jgi:hypothetical protein
MIAMAGPVIGPITWDSYWLPQILNIVINGVIISGVGAAVALFVRRQLSNQLGQHQTTAEDTLTEARAAADNAATASDKASTASENTAWVRAHVEPLLVDRFRIESQELRLKRIEQYLADKETEQHLTGDLAAFQRQEQT